MSFTALRDAAPLPPGVSAGRFFLERLQELCAGAGALVSNARTAQALRILNDLTTRATRDFAQIAREAPVVLSCGWPCAAAPAAAPAPAAPAAASAGAAVIEPGNVAPTPRTE